MIARSRIATIARQLTRSASSSALSPKVLYNSINPHLLEVVLNNEKALNSLDLDMIESLASQIDAWNANSNLKVVVMRGAGKKAFCAGGDVKSLYLAGTSEANKDKQPAILDEFFRKEFTMDYRLTTMKPIQVALWDGIVMGGGVGVSIHSPFRIATENSMFAMPEAKIGFFTDVSGGYFLSRLHDHVGLYLGLTSQRLKGKDLVRAGLANYFIPSARIPELEAALYKSSDPERFTKAGVVSAIQTLAEKVEGPLPNLELIKR